MNSQNKLWKVQITSMDSEKIDAVVKNIVETAKINMVKFSVVPMPTKKKLYSTLSSPFIYKTSMEQYFFVKKKRVIFFSFNTGQSIDMFKNIVIPSGVALSPSPMIKKTSQVKKPA